MTGSIRELAGQLIVHQTAENHRQVRQLLDSLQGAKSDTSQTIEEPKAKTLVDKSSVAQNLSNQRRFAVALSFPGEQREYVKHVSEVLQIDLGNEKVFYDESFKEQLARVNLDTYLQQIYHDDAELIVVFLCAEYEKKEWCGLEWRAIRDIIKQRRDQDVMFFRFDGTMIPGFLSVDGYIDAKKHTAEQSAALILKRLAHNREMPC